MRGPIVILPPTRPGGPERRFAIQPGKVFFLLFICFALGAGAAGTILGLSNQKAIARLEAELTRMQSQPVGAAEGEASEGEQVAEEAAGEAPSEEELANDATAAPEVATLNIPVASLPSSEPSVRVAVLQSRETVVLEGEGIVLAHSHGEPTPMPRGRAQVRPGMGGGIFIEGVGPVREGTPIEARIGPIRIGNREYPGRVQVFAEGGEILLINEVPMESYVAGVVSSEIPASWGLEAKKAQAVAARSYAFLKMETSTKPYDLESSVLDQVYSGKPVEPGSRAAVLATHGEVVALDGRLVSTYYSSSCAGQTEDPANVWPDRATHGANSAECGFCGGSPHKSWTERILPSELLEAVRAAGHDAKEVRRLAVRTSTDSGRISSVEVVTDKGSVTWKGNEFRQRLGFGRVRSTRFSVEFDSNAFVVSGQGFGHGVGLCQWGAQGMDRAGKDYREILQRYYLGSTLEEIY